jgi:hypothetical protein
MEVSPDRLCGNWRVDCDLHLRVDKHLHSATYADNIKHYRLCKGTKVEKVVRGETTQNEKKRQAGAA